MRVVILGGVGWANNVHCCAFSYTSAHTSCYVAVRSLTLLMVWGGGWDVNVPCTSYITCCYAVGWGVEMQCGQSNDSRLHIQFCVEMQCGQGCEIERTWHVGKDLQVKKHKNFFFLMYGDKK